MQTVVKVKSQKDGLKTNQKIGRQARKWELATTPKHKY